MAQIEIDLIGKFGSLPFESIDRFMLQTHINQLADRYNQDRVKQARSYVRSIFDEAIEQEFLTKDPTRKLKFLGNLRPKDKQVLSREQMWLILASTSRRYRLLLMLDMTAALRPSELFALRWKSFDSRNTLSITETVYRGVVRPFGKIKKSLCKMHLPDGLAYELLLWKSESSDASPDAFIFQNADGGILRVDNYRQRVMKPLAQRLGIPRLNLQILRRTMATQAQTMGSVKDIRHTCGMPGRIRQPTSTCRSYPKACTRWLDPST